MLTVQLKLNHPLYSSAKSCKPIKLQDNCKKKWYVFVNSPALKNDANPMKTQGEKGCEIKLAVMIGWWQNFNNDYSGELCADS